MDGKKKKNKKKKGSSQSKLPDANAEEVSVPEQHNGSTGQLNHIPQVPSTSDVQSIGVSESDIELDRHKLYEERFVKLQDKLRQLEDEKNQRLQKEAGLDEKLKSLQGGNDILMLKQAILEDRVKHIEGVKDSWISMETRRSEMVSRFDEVNLKLQEQVKELKVSRDGLLQENAHLRESISMIESRMQRVETEAFLSRSTAVPIAETPIEKIPEYHSEAAPPPLVEKRERDETELIEKVKEVHIESDQGAKVADSPSPSSLDINKPAESDISINYTSAYESPSLARSHNPFGIHSDVDDFNSLHGVRQNHLLGLDNPRMSEDIVSVPLDDIHVPEIEPQTMKEESALPLSDAPLIGAPFRLISFFANYVSGADLVQQDEGSSG